jgi:hypothetical protein
MTTRRLLFTIPLAALFLALTASAILDRALVVYAAPEMQSQFLQAYNPEQVFDRFKDSRYSGSGASGGGAGAGLGVATHSKSVDQELVVHYAACAALMTALDQDMASLLTGTGVQILEKSSKDRNGFQLRYVAGKSNRHRHHQAAAADCESRAIFAPALVPGRSRRMDSHQPGRNMVQVGSSHFAFATEPAVTPPY